MTQTRILFIVAGHNGIGMGHTYRILDLSNQLIQFERFILCTKNSLNSYNYLSDNVSNSVVILQDNKKGLIDYIVELAPQLVIHDILDTEEHYIKTIRDYNINVINFEDLGGGAKYANLVINALYYNQLDGNILYGHEYFDLRTEFLNCDKTQIKNNVENILLSFGGEDPNNITLRILNILTKHSILNMVDINVIIGPAYKHMKKLKKYLFNLPNRNVHLIESSTNMSKYMNICDFAITSNGRTPLELAKLGVPAIVISANERELEHKFPDIAGFYHLGLHNLATDKQIYNVITLICLHKTRKTIKSRLDNLNIGHGKDVILSKIISFVN